MVTGVHFIGGLCGTTMLRAAEMVTEACMKEHIMIKTVIQNVWECPEVDFTRIDILIQMMPLYEAHERVTIFNGKPFISHAGEKQLVEAIKKQVMACA